VHLWTLRPSSRICQYVVIDVSIAEGTIDANLALLAKPFLL
jgi:hypothetical protein